MPEQQLFLHLFLQLCLQLHVVLLVLSVMGPGCWSGTWHMRVTHFITPSFSYRGFCVPTTTILLLCPTKGVGPLYVCGMWGEGFNCVRNAAFNYCACTQLQHECARRLPSAVESGAWRMHTWHTRCRHGRLQGASWEMGVSLSKTPCCPETGVGRGCSVRARPTGRTSEVQPTKFHYQKR